MPKPFIDSQGYRRVWNPDHPNALITGYICEHRLVMSEHLGRPITMDEVVHHINGDPADNRLENLQLTTFQEHPTIHWPRQLQEEIPCACGCGEILQKFDDKNRPRRYIYGHHPKGKKYPSREMPLRVDVDVEEIIRRYQAGEGAPEIAKSLGISPNTVRRRLERAGVKRRSNSEAIKLYQERHGPLRR